MEIITAGEADEDENVMLSGYSTADIVEAVFAELPTGRVVVRENFGEVYSCNGWRCC